MAVDTSAQRIDKPVIRGTRITVELLLRELADGATEADLLGQLRAAGHDVKAVAESWRGATDLAVLEAALTERRVLLTKDKDFGELVCTGGRVVA